MAVMSMIDVTVKNVGVTLVLYAIQASTPRPVPKQIHKIDSALQICTSVTYNPFGHLCHLTAQ